MYSQDFNPDYHLDFPVIEQETIRIEQPSLSRTRGQKTGKHQEAKKSKHHQTHSKDTSLEVKSLFYPDSVTAENIRKDLGNGISGIGMKEGGKPLEEISERPAQRIRRIIVKPMQENESQDSPVECINELQDIDNRNNEKNTASKSQKSQDLSADSINITIIDSKDIDKGSRADIYMISPRKVPLAGGETDPFSDQETEGCHQGRSDVKRRRKFKKRRNGESNPLTSDDDQNDVLEKKPRRRRRKKGRKPKEVWTENDVQGTEGIDYQIINGVIIPKLDFSSFVSPNPSPRPPLSLLSFTSTELDESEPKPEPEAKTFGKKLRQKWRSFKQALITCCCVTYQED